MTRRTGLSVAAAVVVVGFCAAYARAGGGIWSNWFPGGPVVAVPCATVAPNYLCNYSTGKCYFSLGTDCGQDCAPMPNPTLFRCHDNGGANW